ncbi:MAG: type II CAAX endopeptidase family protein [bacterium]|nr:type II CAAX endopeptidase family protein [bacterium]
MNAATLRQAAADALRHPAARLYIALYIVGVVVLGIFNDGNVFVVLVQLFLTAWELIYLAFSIALTPNPPPDQPSPGRSLPAQLVWVVAVLIVSLFIPQIAAAASLDYRLTNPLIYAVIPVTILVFVFAVKPAGLGFRAGYRSLPVALVWMSINGLFVLVQLLTASFSPAFVANRLIGNVLQNGFAEEILWRGVLQTRLSLWLTPPWGIVISALVFGLWHFNANLGMFDGNVLVALAFCIVSQARFGVMMSIVFLRTRSLIAPGLAHTFTNLNPLNFL